MKTSGGRIPGPNDIPGQAHPEQFVCVADAGQNLLAGHLIAQTVCEVAAAEMAGTPAAYPVKVILPDDPEQAGQIRGTVRRLLNEAGWQPDWVGDKYRAGVFRVCLSKRIFAARRWWPPFRASLAISLAVSIIVLLAGVAAAQRATSASGHTLLVSFLCVWVAITCWRSTASGGRWLGQTLAATSQVKRCLPPGWTVSIEDDCIFIKQKKDWRPLMFSAPIETVAGCGAYADLPITAWAQIWQLSGSREKQGAGDSLAAAKPLDAGQDRGDNRPNQKRI